MTSEERRAARYERRKAKRDAKRKAVLDKYGRYEQVIDRDALSKAAKEATRNVMYKASVKRFMLRRLLNVAKINGKLIKHQDVRKGFICFYLVDRGKLRRIMSVHFSERVPQKSLNKNCLVPIFTRSLIYDNGASQKGKGTAFAVNRIIHHLRQYYRTYGSEGYALVIDFHDYFGQIDHGIAKEMIAKYVDDPEIVALADSFVDAYYEHKRRMAKRNGTDPEAEEARGLGLGSETNQTIAITYPNRLDHYIKEALGIRWYERYMDDLVLIYPDKEYLKKCLGEIERICAELKITVNERKTYITKLTHGFTFLKTQFKLTETGRIIRKPSREAFTREERRLRKQAELVAQGIMSPRDLLASYQSFRGGMLRKTARKKLYKTDKLFEKLLNDAIRKYLEGGSNHG